MKNLMLAVLMLFGSLLSPAHAQDGDRCFGAGGDQCGALSGQGFRLSSCVVNPLSSGRSFCSISGGSWAHDECCFDNRQGYFCHGAETSAPNGVCSTEMVRAVSRAGLGYQWTRLVDNQRSDSDGTVNRGEYCASTGKTLHRNDRPFCCNAQPAPQRVSFPFNIGRPSLYRCN